MLIVLKLLGAIAILIFGMKMTSEALQKMAGPQLRHLFGAMTRNRFSGVATGALITVAVQSSSATTVMTVQTKWLFLYRFLELRINNSKSTLEKRTKTIIFALEKRTSYADKKNRQRH